MVDLLRLIDWAIQGCYITALYINLKGVSFMYTLQEKTNSELLSMILNVAEENLRLYKLSDILQAPRAIKGIDEEKQSKLYALKEVARRLMDAETPKQYTIRRPEDIYNFLKPMFKYETKEHFLIIILDTKNQVIAAPTISIGSLSASIVHPREVFSEVLKYPASSVVLAHNHPSGDSSPSKEDLNITRRLVKCGEFMDIAVLDHIIMGNDEYTSLKEQGFIK